MLVNVVDNQCRRPFLELSELIFQQQKKTKKKI